MPTRGGGDSSSLHRRHGGHHGIYPHDARAGTVALKHGTGADVMKRIAAPMVGGLVSSFSLELLVYPALFAIWKRRGLCQQAQ